MMMNFVFAFIVIGISDATLFHHSKTCGKHGTCGVTKFGQPLLLAHPLQSQALPLIAQLPPPPPLVTVPKLLPTVDFTASSLIKEKAVFHKTGLIQVQLPQAAPVIPPAMLTTASQYAVARPKLGVVVDQTEPTYFCKRPGFVLEGQMCVQTLVEPPQLICPGGFDTIDGTCTRRASILQSCPVGYSRRDGQCAKLISAVFLSRCPDGSVPTDLGCERQVPHPLTPTCPEGLFDSLTGTCIVQSYMEAQAYCPEGFEFRDGTCLQEEVYDCSDADMVASTGGVLATAGHTTAIAGPGILPTHHHHHLHHHGRILHAAPYHKDCDTPCTAAPAVCITQRPEPCAVAVPAEVRLQQTQTTIAVQKTCTRVTSTALIFACTDGVLNGNRCLIKQGIPPTPTCTALGDAGYCYARQRVPAIQECPVGFSKECSLGRACECVALESAAFIQSCPSGFEQAFDGCFRTALTKMHCPPGFSLQADACVRILREPADCVFSVTYECDHTKGNCIP
eukprot:Protomagalhaensia_sp_Gyna_25__1088@NODE_152_length_4807_cov_90_610529_g118_i0_p1_GENE_NODE_152_length_4807_cov_90_610529_g118_i0NODE_152_length_4807_cov_90_610529_g118_i0_p1_ORF_typecomplete_len507_score61_85Cornifin/PF02389_15/62Cornifin/PF02389_15/6_1_NODE_152_length_4807_cov_90_610529_g118_i019103430